jgi:hypothetical protein
MNKKTVDNGLIKQGYLDFSKIIEKNKKEFDLNNQTQSEEKNDITIIDDPELHLHLNNDVKKYLQDIVQKQVEEKVQKSLSQIKNELDNTTLGLNTLVEVVRKLIEDDERYKDDSNDITKDIVNSGLFSGAGGIKLNSYSDFKKQEYIKNSQLKVRVMSGDEVVSQNYSDPDFSKYKLTSHVKYYLDEMGRKITWLQEKTQIPYSTLRSIVYNTNTISLENAYRISIVMMLPMEKLFYYIDQDKLQEDIKNMNLEIEE